MIEFAAGNDAAQLLGAWMCWQRWCWETHGRDLDHEAHLAGRREAAASGSSLQVVGWDGGEPVAMVEVRLGYDACRRKTIGMGDHAWVHPNYRQQGVMSDLVAFLLLLGEALRVEVLLAPVTAGANASAPWLQALYERHGFMLTGLTMAKEAA